jgi:hypothetical protein
MLQFSTPCLFSIDFAHFSAYMRLTVAFLIVRWLQIVCVLEFYALLLWTFDCLRLIVACARYAGLEL